MNAKNQYPAMSGCGARISGNQGGSCRCPGPRSKSSGADEYEYPNSNRPRTENSKSTSPYENWSVVNETDKNTLTALRKKACSFITADQEEAPPKALPRHCVCGREPQYVCPTLLKKANDIDYAPQSEFLKRMKQQCQFLQSNHPNIFTAIEEGIVTNADEVENFIIQSSLNHAEGAPDPARQSGTVMNGACRQKLKPPSFDESCEEPCSTDGNNYTYFVEGDHQSNQSIRQSRSTQKQKSEHVSRSKKPQNHRGRRKRKSGSGEEEHVPEGVFEPTLKRPHENSCERCWRFASPSRSPVNKPDQKYDPNFRRGHSCYNFERGDADQDVSDRHISPCKNLQPITTRERTPSVTPPSSPIRKTPPPVSVHKTPSMNYTPGNEIPSYSANAPLPNFLRGTPHPKCVSLWERSGQTPREPYYRQQPLDMDSSPDPIYQQRISEMHPSPHPSFQQRPTGTHQPPCPTFQQESIANHSAPNCQRRAAQFSPQPVRQKPQVQFRSGNNTMLSYHDSSPDSSPERTRLRSPVLEHHPDPNCPLAYTQSVQTSPRSFQNVPENRPNATFTEMKQHSSTFEDLDATGYRTFIKPRERSFEVPETCYPRSESMPLSDDLNATEYITVSNDKNYEVSDSCYSRSVPAESVEVYSPRRVSPTRPSTALEIIPEAENSDSSKTKSVKQGSGSPKKVKSPKNASKQSIRSPRKSSGGSREISRQSVGSSKKSTPSKVHTPNKSGSPKQGKPKSPSPKPSPEKGQSGGGKKCPRKCSKADSKRSSSASDVIVTQPRTPQQRPLSPDVRAGRGSPVKTSVQEPVKSPPNYDRPDHLFQQCPCKPELSVSLGSDYQPGHLICCHCNWQERLKNQANRLGPNKNLNEENPKGYDSMAYRCPYLTKNGSGNCSESFGEAEIRLMRNHRKGVSYEDLSPIPHASPKKYFVFYMTKENKTDDDDDVEVLVEELTQTCQKKTDSRTKDITERMKKIMECPSDSMALRFQKGVSEPCKVPQSSRVLYF